MNGMIGTRRAFEQPYVVRQSLKQAAPARMAKKSPRAAPVHLDCANCKTLQTSISRYDQMLAEERARLAAEQQRKKNLEAELKTFTGPFDEPLRVAQREIITGSQQNIADTQELISKIETVFNDRKEQLRRHTTPPKQPEVPVASIPVPVAPLPVSEPNPTPNGTPTTSTPPMTTGTVPSSTPANTPTIGTTTTRTPPTGSTTTRPPNTGTTGSSPPNGPAQVGMKGPCDDHVAELSNSQRVFHRLFVFGTAKNEGERTKWNSARDALAPGLDGPGRQAPGSTSKTLNEPTSAEFQKEIERLQQTVQPCEEVTIYLSGHGEGGNEHGFSIPGRTAPGEAKGEGFVMRDKTNPATGKKDFAALLDTDLGQMVQGFGPDVSVTVIASVCWGGGFAGKGNVEESRLVKVIGLFGNCPADGSFERAIRAGIDNAAQQSPDGRATANDVKGHLTRNNWIIGEPFDNPTDGYLHKYGPKPN